ncbi:AAA family ATPase [Rhizobium leguminosarum]|uniref:ATP-binding protein n=1 Tax=Rhizobium ruizarguesonis TaxID=2081791 RepID=UPI0013DF449C|nr:ATP-binding protein [Rhizobium ruizarguesonis]NEJ90009.1 AAA family ATPase [Rhizobium ruizarguesonis]
MERRRHGPSALGAVGHRQDDLCQGTREPCDVELVVASAARRQSKGHLGDMQRAMFKSFDDAKKKAPAVLFIDEVDSFTDRDREQSRNASYVRQVINSFLECLDGTAGREGVVVVGACNNPKVMDAAILRPGWHTRTRKPAWESFDYIFAETFLTRTSPSSPTTASVSRERIS